MKHHISAIILIGSFFAIFGMLFLDLNSKINALQIELKVLKDQRRSLGPVTEMKEEAPNPQKSTPEKWSLPRKANHVEFVDLLKQITERYDTLPPVEANYAPNFLAGADPDTKINWHDAYTTSIDPCVDLGFGYKTKGDHPCKGEGRKGDVYISVEGKPTNVTLDTVEKPVPWQFFIRAEYRFPTEAFYLKGSHGTGDFHDFGDYLVKKRLAKHLTELNLDDGCTSEWFEVELPAANGKKHSPFWMGLVRTYYSLGGEVFMEILFKKPEENPWPCDYFT